ncbi:hypothetical protein N2W54_004910 [Lotmaria passim]
MANLFTDSMYVFPVDRQGECPRNPTTCHSDTPGQNSVTDVFAGSTTPRLHPSDSDIISPGLHDAAARERVLHRSPRSDNVISVVTREGDKLHFPVVYGRAGGSIPGQVTASERSASSAAVRSDVASRVHRHASLVSAPISPPNVLIGEAAEDETPEEAAETYQHSRATPASIQRHRRNSCGCSRSPPPSVALRGEPVEDTVRATSSQLPSASSSLANTPRQSIRRTPASSPLHELSSLDGGSAGVVARVEEMGVSTPEMAEYFADGIAEAQQQSSSGGCGGSTFGGSTSSVPSRRNFVTPRHSQQYGGPPLWHHGQTENGGNGVVAAAATGPRVNHFVLDRLMHLVEELSRVSQQLLQRVDALESTNRAVADRLSTLEALVKANQRGEPVDGRVSAESRSPSATRASGPVDSATQPSTRAPSKAVH